MKSIYFLGMFVVITLFESCTTNSYKYLSHKGLVSHYHDLPLYKFETTQKLILDITVLETDTLNVTFHFSLDNVNSSQFKFLNATSKVSTSNAIDSAKSKSFTFSDLKIIYLDLKNNMVRYEAKMSESDFLQWIQLNSCSISLSSNTYSSVYYPEFRFINGVNLIKESFRHKL
ncbi:MAG: hypothetical protein SFU91_10435 [Chloroherpetonaceae bacterium]|nr:hypothetical protein [Chloroherpetonaceae bacterium]